MPYDDSNVKSTTPAVDGLRHHAAGLLNSGAITPDEFIRVSDNIDVLENFVRSTDLKWSPENTPVYNHFVNEYDKPKGSVFVAILTSASVVAAFLVGMAF